MTRFECRKNDNRVTLAVTRQQDGYLPARKSFLFCFLVEAAPSSVEVDGRILGPMKSAEALNARVDGFFYDAERETLLVKSPDLRDFRVVVSA